MFLRPSSRPCSDGIDETTRTTDLPSTPFCLRSKYAREANAVSSAREGRTMRRTPTAVRIFPFRERRHSEANLYRAVCLVGDYVH